MKFRVILTQKCNLKCFYCYKEGIFSKRSEALSEKDFKNSIKAARESGFDEIKFTYELY